MKTCLAFLWGLHIHSYLIVSPVMFKNPLHWFCLIYFLFKMSVDIETSSSTSLQTAFTWIIFMHDCHIHHCNSSILPEEDCTQWSPQPPRDDKTQQNLKENFQVTFFWNCQIELTDLDIFLDFKPILWETDRSKYSYWYLDKQWKFYLMKSVGP